MTLTPATERYGLACLALGFAAGALFAALTVLPLFLRLGADYERQAAVKAGVARWERDWRGVWVFVYGGPR